jgi:hypothetical protein
MTHDSNAEKDFDLPQGDATPPPEGSGPQASPSDFDLPESDVTPPPAAAPAGQPQGAEPHVRKAEEAKPASRGSLWGKIIALVVLPAILLTLILVQRHNRQQTWVAYRFECVATAGAFLKGISDGTQDSVPAAYDLLFIEKADGTEGPDAEWVEGNYKEAAAGLGAFKSLQNARWKSDGAGEFTAEAQCEKGAFPVRFAFVRVNGRMRITGYSLGGK